MTALIGTATPVFLLGFMGSGKTHWGSRWAKQAGLRFIDLDNLIEEKQGLPVSEIFESHGENFFREIESSTLKSLPGAAGIIACGGGTPCFHNNMKWMNEHGATIYLKARPAFLLSNILREPNVRPLVKNMSSSKILEFIEHTMKEREAFYSQAQFTIDAEHVNADSLQQIIKQNT